MLTLSTPVIEVEPRLARRLGAAPRGLEVAGHLRAQQRSHGHVDVGVPLRSHEHVLEDRTPVHEWRAPDVLRRQRVTQLTVQRLELSLSAFDEREAPLEVLDLPLPELARVADRRFELAASSSASSLRPCSDLFVGFAPW